MMSPPHTGSGSRTFDEDGLGAIKKRAADGADLLYGGFEGVRSLRRKGEE